MLPSITFAPKMKSELEKEDIKMLDEIQAEVMNNLERGAKNVVLIRIF